ncbi:oligomeric Golgi complex subunit 7 [Fimicolochytrium jonesii]|uniref:oligomeric Golgi complex subunit 7 n=1 Tax=Fimicolochytrium jonesii TaxID=1396493 RepID=UPI0022FE36E2|nr:oligomeric Golgi complex subunit 7 [Fimicolochytrium jonesii]KAI8822483.1 oligomeric Golgi complex subunit 7 [Fimicolochytrium jonesii]
MSPDDIPRIPAHTTAAPLYRSLSATTNGPAIPNASAYGIDLDAFLAPDFNAKAWINAALATPYGALRSQQRKTDSPLATKDANSGEVEDVKLDSSTTLEAGPDLRSRRPSEIVRADSASNASVDVVASNLVLKLQLLSLDVSMKFEQLSEEAVRNMPRAMYDLELIRKDADKVKEAIRNGRTVFESAEKGGGGAFKDLMKLDRVRNRMTATRHSLKEAENWSTLSGEMNAIFSAGDFEKASVRLDEARKSLVLLSASPDYAEREALLDELQATLQTATNARVLAVFNDHDAEGARKLYRIYSRIDRLDYFMQQYEKVCAAPLLRFWQQYDEASILRAAKAGYDDEFAQWLTNFYDEAYRLVQKEFAWIPYIFPSAIDAVQGLISGIFRSLEPSLENRLKTFVENMGDASLPGIVKAYQSAVQFGIRVERLIFLADPGDLRNAPVLDDDGQLRDSVTSLHNDSDLPAQPGTTNQERWGTTVFEPFLAYQQRYGQLERNHLLASTATILRFGKGNSLEATRLMNESVPKAITLAESAWARCRQFTSGFGHADLVEALDEHFVAIMRRYGTLLHQLRGDVGLTGQSTISSEDEEPGEFRSGDFGNQEWGRFQIGLKVLGLCSLFQKKLLTFERTLRRGIKTFATTHHKASWANPAEFWGDEKEHSNECFASIDILRLSTLNSYKLETLGHDQPASNVDVGDAVPPSPLFHRAIQVLKTFTIDAQQFVFDTLFTIIEQQLRSVSTMEIWTADAPKTAGPFNLGVPQFSLSPLSYITRVGEHLLTLPQQLELYVDDDALKFSVRTLPHITAQDFEVPEAGNKGDNPEDDVTYLWILSIARGTMLRYADVVMRMQALSQDGAKQLCTDMGYLMNVFDALDIEPITRFGNLHAMMCMTGEDLKRRYAAAKQGRPEDEADEKLFADETFAKHLAAIRGLDVGRYP